MASDITPNGKAYTLSDPDETDNNVRSFYIKVKDCKGTFGYSVTAGLYVDLDKDAELAKEENNRIANDGHIINYGFMRMLYDNALQEYDYAGVSSPQYCNVTDVDTVTQIGNDDENYGNFVRREYAKCYLREVSVMMGSKTSSEPSRMAGSSNTGYNMDVITSGEIFNPDAAGELRKFALYSILPKEFNMSESLFSNSNFISGFAYDTSGLEVDNDAFESHVSDIEIKTLSDGRKVIYLEFDFSDRPLELSKRINVSVNYTTSIGAKVLDACTDQNFTIESRTAVLDNGYIVIRKNTTEAGDTNKWNEVRAEPAVTGNNDLLLAGSYHRDFLARNPSSWQNRAIKAAKRGDSIDYSRDFEVDTAEKIDINAYNENAGADNSNTVYTYEIGISLRDIRTEDIVLYDYIEGYSSTETGGSVWHGVPLSVDTTKLCNKGFTTEVYYKIVPDGEDVNEDTVTDNSLTGWTLLNSADNKIWEFPDIAQGTKVAVAIKLNTDSFHDGYYEAPVDKNEYLFAYIKMRSPTPTQSSVDESAYNNCFVKWMPHDETKYNDIVSPSSTVTLRTEIFIIKQDEANTNITLPGAVFEIYADDMITLVTTVTTDRFGKAQINGLVYGERYYYKEVKAPAGYQLDDTMKELLYSYTASPIPVHVDNHAIAGRVTLQKVDKNNSSITIPEGAHYSFYSREGVLMELYTTNTPGYYSFDDIDSTSTTTTDLVTNNESKIVISDVPLGVYYFVETMAPDGYILDETPLYAVVDKALATGVETEYIEISVTHAEEERLFSAELTKVDAEDDSIKLADAWFNLLMLKPDTTDQWVICKEYLRTDMYGSLKVTDLVYGTYKFEEILPPEGYEMNQSPYSEEFTISPNDYGATDSEIVTQITMTNPRKKGSVMLNKVDMETKSPLIGAIMDLYKKGDTIENDVKIGSENYRVDSTGRLVFYPLIDTMDKYIYTGLDWGEYYSMKPPPPQAISVPRRRNAESFLPLLLTQMPPMFPLR